jgi:hypothetical protein
MTTTLVNLGKAFALIALALAIGAMGFYVANADDAPGAAVTGLLLMIAAVVLGVKAGRGRLPVWAARTALAVGALVAAFAAFLTHATVVAAPLFPEPQAVPSVAQPAPAPQWAAGADRARQVVRTAMADQNLPGVSIAVGAGLRSGALAKEGGQIIWAEGFGWRDVETRTPVTPSTRFNIGTAASVVTTAAVASLGLTNTGADPAKEWSPEAIGEEGEDFPPLTLLRHLIWQPLGLMPSDYPLRGERATFYVPRSDDNPRRGRRLMYMRDLACCASGKASYSTPSDLVRVGLSRSGSVDGELAGGLVMSMVTRPDSGVVVVVMSNIAHANTSALALTVANAFAEPSR